MSDIYNRFASVYDRMAMDHHSLRMCEYTLELFKRFRITGNTGLEICCGTGSALEFFTERGYTMAGVDQSPQMLAHARKKLPRSVSLVCATLPKFRITEPARPHRTRRFDFACSYFDSLNYLLKPHDLQATFTGVARHLKPGGWFIFDMNTPHGLKTVWANTVFGGALDDIGWIFRNSYDNAKVLGSVRTTFFVKRGKLWERFDETHVERGYSLKDLRAMLRAGGFEVRAMYKCATFERATDKTNRVCVVARKR
jgi:SAM-dependent methyltransferase